MSAQHSPTDLDQYLQAAFDAAEGAGRILNRHFGNLRKIDEKFQAGLVSEADKESEAFIKQLFASRFPDHAVLGEESGLSTPLSTSGVQGNSDQKTGGKSGPGGQSNKLWIIDPLDGTTNYVHQFPVFCISIGLEIDGELVLGVVDAPKLGKRFHAVKGRGAYCNDERIHVSKRDQFKDGLFATGFFGHDEALDEQLELCAHVIRQSRGLRRAGSAAMDLCFVAQGVFDAFWERNLSPWDTAAGIVIAREAGALATDMQGAFFEPRMKSILCGNPALHAEMLKQIAAKKR